MIINKIKAFATTQNATRNEVDVVSGHIRYNLTGSNKDTYSLDLIDAIRSSTTASAIYRTKASFVSGSGCSNPLMGRFITDKIKDQKLNGLITDLANDVVKHKQIYILIRMASNGFIGSIERLSPQNCRLTLPVNNNVTHVKYSGLPFGSSDFDINKTATYPLYDVNSVEPLQIYYHNFDKEYNDFYPYPLSETQFKLFKSDTQITNFNYSNLTSGFFGGAFISMTGNPLKQVATADKDSDGNIVTENYGDVVAREISRNDLGADNAGNLKIIWNQSEREGGAPALITQIESNNNSDLYSKTLADIIDNIARFIGVPTILANIQVSGKLGATNEVLNSIDLLIAHTENDRVNIENIINKLIVRFFDWHELFQDELINIQPLSLVKSLPDFAWSVLTLEEQRVFVKDNFNISMIQTETETGKELEEVKPLKKEVEE
jgi:hypothetical protein